MALSALLLGFAAAVYGLLLQRRELRTLQELRLGMARTAAAALEGARMEAQLETLRQVQEVAEKGVEFGAEAVRAVHLGIASIPFSILEAIPVTRDTTRVVRGLHDGISNVVYDSITGVNRLLGGVLRQGLPGREKTRQQDPDEDHKPEGP